MLNLDWRLLLGGVICGVFFGFAFERSRVLEPAIIIGQLQFRRFTMLKVFLTAIATSAMVFLLLHALGYERVMWKVTTYPIDILGGAILGIGVALAGACPGTVYGQIGVGYKDAWVTALGALVGASVFPTFKDWIYKILAPAAGDITTLDQIWGLSPITIWLGLIALITALLFALENHVSWKKDIQDL